MSVQASVTGLILAGGRARRLGGVDKGLAAFRGKPLVEHVIERLRPQVTTLLISANRNTDRYRATGWPVMADDLAGFQGPLAGIVTALRRVETDYLLSAPCDAPCLPPDLCQRLLTASQRAGLPLAVAHDGERTQYAFALVGVRCLDSLEACLASGERSLRGWFAGQAHALADFSDQPEAFVNINRREDLIRLEGGR